MRGKTVKKLRKLFAASDISWKAFKRGFNEIPRNFRGKLLKEGV